MNEEELIAAVEGLLAGLADSYLGEVPDVPAYPYLLLNTNLPRASERAITRQPLARQVRVRVTVVGLTIPSVRIIAAAVDRRLEGARPLVSGWRCGRVENSPTGVPISRDAAVVLPGTKQHPLFTVLEYITTVSKTA